MSFDLGGEALLKGFRLEGDAGGVRSVEARVDGRPLPAGQVRSGRGALPDVKGPALFLWLPGARRAPVTGAVDPETEKRLRALGYIQ